MNIMFSQAAAEAACTELMFFSDRLVVLDNSFYQIRQGVKNAWTGPLCNQIVAKLNSDSELLDQIPTFVQELQKTIATCRKNYITAEQANIDITAHVTELFM